MSESELFRLRPAAPRGFWQYLHTGVLFDLFVHKDERMDFAVSAFSFADLFLLFFGVRLWA